MDPDRKIIRWPVLALAAVVLLIGFFFLMGQTQGEIDRLLAQEAELVAQRDKLDDVYAELKAQLRLVGSDGFVETEARKNYEFINQGEVCFEFTNADLLDNYTEEEVQIIMEEKRYW